MEQRVVIKRYSGNGIRVNQSCFPAEAGAQIAALDLEHRELRLCIQVDGFLCITETYYYSGSRQKFVVYLYRVFLLLKNIFI